MSDATEPDQSEPDQSEPDRGAPDQSPPVDPVTGEDLSWRHPAVAMVLFDRPAPSHAEIADLLTEVFDGSYEVDPGTEDDPASAVTVEDATVFASPLDSPVAGGQATRFAADLPMWNGEESVVDSHRSQVVVAGMRLGPADDDGEFTDPEYLDPRLEALRCELAVAQVAAVLTALPGAIAVSVGGAANTLPAGAYRDLVTGNPIPVPALVGVRAGMLSETTSCAYTTGLGRFGRADLERIDVPAPPGEVYGQMCDLVAFCLGSGTVFQADQTLEVGGPEQLVTSVETSPLTGMQVLRLSPASAGPGGGSARGTAPGTSPGDAGGAES